MRKPNDMSEIANYIVRLLRFPSMLKNTPRALARGSVFDTLILITGILLFLISYIYDNQIRLFFKSFKLPFLDAILSIITNFGLVIVVLLIVPSIMLYKKNKGIVYFFILTFIVSFVLAFIIKLIVLRQRPIEAFSFPLINIINYSFPSMHSMVAFSLLPILTKYLPKHKYFWTAFAFLVGFSRVYLGFHFLSDVVFGALFGYIIGKNQLFCRMRVSSFAKLTRSHVTKKVDFFKKRNL